MHLGSFNFLYRIDRRKTAMMYLLTLFGIWFLLKKIRF